MATSSEPSTWSRDNGHRSRLSTLCRAQTTIDALHKAVEISDLVGELLASGWREPVKACPAIVVGTAPFCGDPSLQQQALQGGVERSFCDLEHSIGGLLDGLRDAVAVLDAAGQCFQDQQIECAW